MSTVDIACFAGAAACFAVVCVLLMDLLPDFVFQYKNWIKNRKRSRHVGVMFYAGMAGAVVITVLLWIVAGMQAWVFFIRDSTVIRRLRRAPKLTREQQIEKLEHHKEQYETIRAWGQSPMWNDHFGWMPEPIRDPEPDWMEIAVTVIKHLPANAHRVVIDETVVHWDAAGNIVIDESCLHGKQWTEGQCPCGYATECAVHCGPGHTNGQCPPLTAAVRYSR